MRWFKHFTNAFDDEAMAELCVEFGLEAYGVWWRVLEIIADKMEKGSLKTEASYPKKKWLSLLALHHKRQHVFFRVVDFLASGDKPKLTVTYNGDIVTINCPKLMEIRDEYSRKSRQAPDKLLTHSRQTPEPAEKQPPQKIKETNPQSKPPGQPESSKPTTEEQLQDLLVRYSEQEQAEIRNALELLRLTRKGGKLADSIVLTEVARWNTLDVQRTMYGIRKYVDKSYYAEGKKEGYLWSIMKNATPAEIMRAQRITPLNGSPAPSISPVTDQNIRVIQKFREGRNAVE